MSPNNRNHKAPTEDSPQPLQEDGSQRRPHQPGPQLLVRRTEGPPCTFKSRPASAGHGVMGSEVTSPVVSLFLPCPFMDLYLSHCKPTWTEGAKKCSQGVHFPRNQLIADFFLVFRWREKALRKNPGLVFSWKTDNFHWAPPRRISTGAPGWQGLCPYLLISPSPKPGAMPG